MAPDELGPPLASRPNGNPIAVHFTPPQIGDTRNIALSIRDVGDSDVGGRHTGRSDMDASFRTKVLETDGDHATRLEVNGNDVVHVSSDGVSIVDAVLLSGTYAIALWNSRVGYLAHPSGNMAGVGRASGPTGYFIRAPTGDAFAGRLPPRRPHSLVRLPPRRASARVDRRGAGPAPASPHAGWGGRSDDELDLARGAREITLLDALQKSYRAAIVAEPARSRVCYPSQD